jgi:3-deoxy-7-phosphoheptulonate synthase
VQVATDALIAARASHAFIGMTKMAQAAVFETRGNDDTHVILRGGKAPNYDAAGVNAACLSLARAGLTERLMVDCSHANAGKDYLRQIEIANDVAVRIGRGERRIVGVMLESHLEEGRQDLKRGSPLKRGVSITDACLGWSQTEPVLRGLAQAVKSRRGSTGSL